MGLDMYLEGRKFLLNDWENPTNNRSEDGFKIKEVTLELGYWRKHPNLHGYIVQTFANGVDECQDIELSIKNCEQIIAAVKAKQLPNTTGFFFGASDGNEIDEDVKIFEKAIAWEKSVTSRLCWPSIVYRASW